MERANIYFEDYSKIIIKREEIEQRKSLNKIYTAFINLAAA